VWLARCRPRLVRIRGLVLRCRRPPRHEEDRHRLRHPGGVLIAALKFVEYRYLVATHAVEIYGGIVALLFTVLGIWLGRKLTRTRETIVVREVEVPVPVEVG